MSQEQFLTQKNNFDINPELNDLFQSSSMSVIVARNRLKQSEDKLYLAKHKLDILQTKQCKAFNQSLENARKSTFYKEISDFANDERNRKQKNLDFRRMQLEDMRKRNSQVRSEHKNKMAFSRQSFFQKNKQIHHEAQKARKKNQKLIQIQKKKEINRKKQLRGEIYNSVKQAHAYVGSYIKNKRLQNFLNREQQKNEINFRISENEQQIKQYCKDNEEAQQELNQLIEESRVLPVIDSSPGFQGNSKGFRVKYQSRNQTTVMIQ